MRTKRNDRSSRYYGLWLSFKTALTARITGIRVMEVFEISQAVGRKIIGPNGSFQRFQITARLFKGCRV
jgi:hypothetical protein